jgi:predicted AAA+ superfamily ATPase
MVAHSHGGIWSAADPARSLAIGESTVRRYLDLFTSLLMVRQLQPWQENLNKRQVKAPMCMYAIAAYYMHCSGCERKPSYWRIPKAGPRGKVTQWRKSSKW